MIKMFKDKLQPAMFLMSWQSQISNHVATGTDSLQNPMKVTSTATAAISATGSATADSRFRINVGLLRAHQDDEVETSFG